eukprot:TRINITY_DN593_c0_g1_i2.p1 TRINITY_DN593_c0_g1~~TRINITY_DN593_c0_g1_i2.p1  ORF type:complete len:291 (+),score=59.27 TRINITY_DN593_c0_g1_i2:1-873(+)
MFLGRMRVFCVSDIHTNYPDNWSWCQSISSQKYVNDVIIVAGDVSHEFGGIRNTLKCLKDKFLEVFFVPGNHDLWLVNKSEGFRDSIEKFAHLQSLCDELGVHTSPQKLANKVWIVPMHSWYEESFDNEPDSDQHPIPKKNWNDYNYCKWNDSTSTDSERCRFFHKLNEDSIARVTEEHKANPNTKIITFSHYLPRRECLPPRSKLWIPYLPKVVGSPHLEEQLRRLRPNIHVYGHTHINMSVNLDDTLYIQRALMYPSERTKYPPHMIFTDMDKMMIWDSDQPDASHAV